MSFVAHVLAFLLITGLVALAGLAVAFLLARGYLRRHWRLWRGHVVVRGLMAGLAALAAGREWYGARATPDEMSRGTSARVRRRMWVAVEDAEHTVEHANSHDAPVGELASVCRSLRSAAGELDGLLRLERRLPFGPHRPDAVRRQVAEVIGAARDVQAAALRAGSDAAAPQVRSLVRQAAEEVAIVTSALSRMRSVAPPR
jgi:hypothetical protein